MCTQPVLVVCLVAAFCLAASSASAVTEYVVTDLGTVGGTWSEAYGLNDSAQVVGHSQTSGPYVHAFLWEEGAMQAIGTWAYTQAYAINGVGRAVGWAKESGARHSYYWEFGEAHKIGLSLSSDEARGVNDLGQVVGYVIPRDGIGDYHAYLWDDGVWQDLGTLGGADGDAYAINDSTQVVGVSDTAGGNAHAFFWQDGAAMQDLGTLGGLESHANDINNLGRVVGWAETADLYPHAFSWQGGAMVDLGVLDGDWSRAYGINDLGQTVGGADVVGHYPGHAFLWQDGAMYDLNDLVFGGSDWVLEVATDINGAGQIVGYGVNPDGYTRGFLLTPIPEPSVVVLASLGLFGLPFSAGLRRMKVLRRRRSGNRA